MALGQLAITPHEHRAFAGNDWRLGVTLYENGAALSVTGTTIEAVIRDANGYNLLQATQSSSTTGASWGSGVVVLAFAAADTASFLRDVEYYVEIRVTAGDGTRKTWPLLPVLVSTTAF